MRTHILTEEGKYFDFLINRYGETWWGNTTRAGIERQNRRAKMLKKMLYNYNSPVVLEIGCGTGMFSHCIVKEFSSIRLIGCDVSQKAVEIAKERCADYPNTNFLIADAVSLPFRDGMFESVIGNSILHHLPLEQALKECYRVLRYGGIIWFSEPNMLNPHIFIEKNVSFIGKILQNTKGETAFLRWSLKKKLKRVGFQKIVVRPFDFLYPLIPWYLIRIINKIGNLMERIFIVKEIAGSLSVTAYKQ